MNSFNIRVKPDFTYDRVQVAGREFLKSNTRLAEHELNTEIRNSPLLIVEPIADPASTVIAPIEPPSDVPPLSEPIIPPAAKRKRGDA